MSDSARPVNGFEDLAVFKRAYKISLEIHSLTMSFPKIEQYAGLADQMRRASKGICANIAEGYGKQSISTAEFRRFLLMAIGSADEMRVWIRYSLDFEYVTRDQWQSIKTEYQEIARMLTALHRSWK